MRISPPNSPDRRSRPASYTPPYDPIVPQLKAAKIGPGQKATWKTGGPLPFSEEEKASARTAASEAFRFAWQEHSASDAVAKIRRAFTEDLVERCAAALSSSGTLLRVHLAGETRQLGIEIVQGGQAPFNRFAARIFEKYGTRIVVVPEVTLARQLGAAVTPDGRTMILGESACDPRPSERLVLHETRHLHRKRQTHLKVPSPYYGNARSDAGGIPNEGEYARYHSIDEMDVYAYNVRALLVEWQSALREGGASPPLELLDLFTEAGTKAVRCNLWLAAQIAKCSENQIHFERDAGLVVAHLELAGKNGSPIQVRIPLVEAEGVSDDRNIQLLDDQVAWMKRAAQGHAAQFELVRWAVSAAAPSGAINGDDPSAVIRALRVALRDRAFASSMSAEPPSGAELTRRFSSEAGAGLIGDVDARSRSSEEGTTRDRGTHRGPEE